MLNRDIIYPEIAIREINNTEIYTCTIFTNLRKLHKDGKWYKCYIQKTYMSTTSDLNKFSSDFISFVYDSIILGLVVPELKLLSNEDMFIIDRNQISEEERLQNIRLGKY